MAKLGRNEPCPCGSGRKVKLCCGTHRGPSPEDLAWQTLHDQARKFAPLLRPYTNLTSTSYWSGSSSCQSTTTRYRSVSPGSGLQNWNDFEPASATSTDAIQAAAATIDGPGPRLRPGARPPNSASATKIDLESLAIIIVDLARPIFLFISASLIAATAVSLGRCPTPTGLLVAAT